MARRGSLARLARPGTRPYSAAARSTPGWRAWPCLRLRALHLLSGRVALPVKLHSWAALGGAPCSRVSVCPRASGPETWRKRWSRRRRCRRVAPHRRARSAGCFSCHRACHRRRVPWVCATSRRLRFLPRGGCDGFLLAERYIFLWQSTLSCRAASRSLPCRAASTRRSQTRACETRSSHSTPPTAMRAFCTHARCAQARSCEQALLASAPTPCAPLRCTPRAARSLHAGLWNKCVLREPHRPTATTSLVKDFHVATGMTEEIAYYVRR